MRLETVNNTIDWSWTNPYEGTSGSATAPSVEAYKKQSDIVLGDHVSPLPFRHEWVLKTGSHTRKAYTKKWVGDYRLYTLTYDEPVHPLVGQNISDNWVGPIKSTGYSTEHGDYTQANNKMLERLYQNQIDFGTMVAELTETVPYLVSKVKNTALALKAIKKGRWHKALRHFGIDKKQFRSKTKTIKKGASLFIEYRFAIAPTLNDINSVMDLHKGTYKKQHAFTFSVKGKHKETRDYNASNTVYPLRTTTVKRTGQRTMRVKVHGSITDMDKVRDKAFGIDSLAGPIWQIMPWSWVVDYVVNIGDYISLLSATKGTAFLNGYQSTRTICEASHEVDQVYSRPENRFSETIISKHICNGYVRGILTAYPVPKLEVVLPNISLRQVSNLTAVLAILKL